MATWVLIGVTAVYVALTYVLVRDNHRQVRKASNPVVGCRVRTCVFMMAAEGPMLDFGLDVSALGGGPALNLRGKAVCKVGGWLRPITHEAPLSGSMPFLSPGETQTATVGLRVDEFREPLVWDDVQKIMSSCS